MTYCHQNCCRDEDRKFFEREIASFLPDRIFDAHCHLAKWGQIEMLKGQILPENFNRDMGYHEYRDREARRPRSREALPAGERPARPGTGQAH